MEEKLKELIDINKYFQEVCSTRNGQLDNLSKLEVSSRVLRDIFTSTRTTNFTVATVENLFRNAKDMRLLPAAYGGIDNVEKLIRVMEIAQDWVSYKNNALANASSKAYLTVSLNKNGDVVITLTDPYGQP